MTLGNDSWKPNVFHAKQKYVYNYNFLLWQTELHFVVLFLFYYDNQFSKVIEIFKHVKWDCNDSKSNYQVERLIFSL